jgi:hypothetical protein
MNYRANYVHSTRNLYRFCNLSFSFSSLLCCHHHLFFQNRNIPTPFTLVPKYYSIVSFSSNFSNSVSMSRVSASTSSSVLCMLSFTSRILFSKSDNLLIYKAFSLTIYWLENEQERECVRICAYRTDFINSSNSLIVYGINRISRCP